MDTLFCQTSAVAQPKEDWQDLSGYPNPANDEFVLTLGTKASGVVHVYDQYGRTAYRSGFHENTKNLSINTSRFNSGVYFVEIRGGHEQLHSMKFFVQH